MRCGGDDNEVGSSAGARLRLPAEQRDVRGAGTGTELLRTNNGDGVCELRVQCLWVVGAFKCLHFHLDIMGQLELVQVRRSRLDY